MNPGFQAVQSPYYGDAYYRKPPPDLASLLLKERIVYLGLPLAPQVAQLIVAELLYLQYDDPEKPIKLYVNSMGEYPGLETSAFAICDTMSYIKPPIHTICIGAAFGMSAMILASGTPGFRLSLPHATIVLNDTSGSTGGRSQATDIQIRAKEVLASRQAMIEILAQQTQQDAEKIRRDIDRPFYMNPVEAKEYGLIDRILESEAELEKPLPAGAV